MSPLFYTSYSNIYDTGVHPYQNAISGNDYIVYTDRGNPVIAWVAYGGTLSQRNSWCHGFSLGTFDRWGYSVYSGYHIGRALADEYKVIHPSQARNGDIIAWRTGNSLRDFPHSAILRKLVLINPSTPDLQNSRMDSKNGSAQVQYNIAIDVMTAQYGSMIEFYRRLRP